MNKIEADLDTAQNPRLSTSEWLELFGIYFKKYINQPWLYGQWSTLPNAIETLPDEHIKMLFQNKNAQKDILENVVYFFDLPKDSSEEKFWN